MTNRWHPQAFTLVELLVVVSIIALLIAILLPSLRKAREQAKIAVCLANLTGLTKASLIYADEDPNELMIPVPDTSVLPEASGAIEWGGKAGKGQSPDGEVANSIFGTASYRGPAHRPLNLSLYKGGFKDFNPPYGGVPDPGPGFANYKADQELDLPIYRCPSDTGYAGGGFLYESTGKHDRNERAFRDEMMTAYDHYGTSFVANTFWIVDGITEIANRVRSQSVYLMPLSRIPSPAASIAYQEVPSRYAWLWGDWSAEGQCDYSDRVEGNEVEIPGWHRNPFNFDVAFADGHAAMITMKGCYRPAPNLGEGNYPTEGSGSSTTLYDYNRCVTIRGPGWQLDTLPAPAVLTPYYKD
ncbi:MAG: prepilin-type N-terminal cleavage/methylation domain-containing protein [Phycisphaerae bacterium]|nr:prepilin-type N-terminal cleavage/methylation domain-containing protein [Phycisphaerae bacterium]